MCKPLPSRHCLSDYVALKYTNRKYFISVYSSPTEILRADIIASSNLARWSHDRDLFDPITFKSDFFRVVGRLPRVLKPFICWSHTWYFIFRKLSSIGDCDFFPIDFFLSLLSLVIAIFRSLVYFPRFFFFLQPRISVSMADDQGMGHRAGR